MDIHKMLAQEFSLEQAVCIADVGSQKQKEALQKNGYPNILSKNEWIAQFPSISPQKIFCLKSSIGIASLLYLDTQHYISFFTHIYGDQAIASVTLKQISEDKLNATIKLLESKYKEKDYASLLSPICSEHTGNIAMYLFKLMLEREEPSESLYRAFLKCYVSCDYGINQFPINLIKKIKKCKTKQQKQATQKNLSSYPSIITIYRGEGNLSTPWNQSFSWTTNINKAYFFASWRSSENSRIITATIKKENVIEFVTERNEFEIIADPDNVTYLNTQLCYDFEWFVRIITSGFSGYNEKFNLEKFSAKSIMASIEKIYASNNTNTYHDLNHAYRVTLFASFLYKIDDIASTMSAGTKVKEIVLKYYDFLITAAEWHDVGRTNDDIDFNHGLQSYKHYIKRTGKTNDILKFLIKYHCRDDNVAKKEWEKKFQSHPDKKIIWHIFCILKDADALDRLRFGFSSLDINYFRLENSKFLIPAAAKLQSLKI